MKLFYQSVTDIEEFDQDEDGETCVVSPLEEFEVDEEDFKKAAMTVIKEKIYIDFENEEELEAMDIDIFWEDDCVEIVHPVMLFMSQTYEHIKIWKEGSEKHD